MGSARSGLCLRTPIAQEEARDVRVRAWAYAFECFHRREIQEGDPTAADDAMKGFKDDRARSILPE